MSFSRIHNSNLLKSDGLTKSFCRLASVRWTALFRAPPQSAVSELRRGVSFLLALNVAGALLLELQTQDATQRILFSSLALVQYLHLTFRRNPSWPWLLTATLSTVHIAYYLNFWSLGVEVSVFSYIAVTIANFGRTDVISAQEKMDEQRIFIARWVTLFLYSLKALYSVSLHQQDPFWREGTIGNTLLTSTFMSRFAHTWQHLLSEYHVVGEVISLLSATFIPIFGLLVLFVLIGGQVARFCVQFSLLSFFLFSLFFLNLGILPFVEILLWRFWFSKQGKNLSRPPFWEGGRAQVVVERSRPLPVALRRGVGVILIASTTYILSIPNIAGITTFDDVLVENRAIVLTRHTLGLAPINVFNTVDLQMSSRWIVVTEKEGRDGIFTRQDGSRTPIQMLDAVYFGSTLKLRREMIGMTQDEVCRRGEVLIHERRFEQVSKLLRRSATEYFITVFEQPVGHYREEPQVLCTFTHSTVKHEHSKADQT